MTSSTPRAPGAPESMGESDLFFPLLMRPRFDPKPWGGRRLAEQFHKPIPDGAIGESWEISTTGGKVSRVEGGPLDGMPLDEVLRRWPNATMGRLAGQDFPLLVKFIDASESLSVQVHPDDAMAQRLEDFPRGKTEAWIVLDARGMSAMNRGLSAMDRGLSAMDRGLSAMDRGLSVPLKDRPLGVPPKIAAAASGGLGVPPKMAADSAADSVAASAVDSAAHAQGDAEAGHVIHGLLPGTTRAQLAAVADTPAIENHLRRLPIRRGTVVPVTAGTVHAILGGTLLCEVQQASDITYRLYDWDRKPKRALHIEQSLDSIDFAGAPPDLFDLPPHAESTRRPRPILDMRYFSLSVIDLPGGLEGRPGDAVAIDMADGDFALAVVLDDGGGAIDLAGEGIEETGIPSLTLTAGRSVFIPAASRGVVFRSTAPARILWVRP